MTLVSWLYIKFYCNSIAHNDAQNNAVYIEGEFVDLVLLIGIIKYYKPDIMYISTCYLEN